MTGKSLRIVFMGTPDFAVPALEYLIDGGHDVVAVYTQPPRPKGRGKKVQPSPVHDVADVHNIPVETPQSFKDNADALKNFAAYRPDVAVVVAYGLILPQAVLDMPRHGCFNIHASLLPRWRGAAPIQHAIRAGDDETGVSIMQMEAGLDTGPVAHEKRVPVRPQSTARTLHDELAALGGAAIHRVIDRLAEDGAVDLTPQHNLEDRNGPPTYASKLTKADGRIDWSQTAAAIDRQIRAFNPWPGVWTVTKTDDRRFKILEAEPVKEHFSAPPGTVIDAAGHVACGGDTALKLLKIQPQNARPMALAAAVNGHYLKDGARFV